MASPEFDKYLNLLKKFPPPERVNIPAMREMTDKAGGSFPEGVTGAPVQAGGVPAEWIDAPGGSTDHALLYLHGGGYVAGSIDSHRNLTGHLAQALGCRVLALDYRLAPENVHPAPVEDSVAAYNWLLAEGFEPGHLAIAGDSAGGGLTFATLLKLRDTGVALPAAAVGISPWVDMSGSGESMTTRAAVDPMVQPGMLGQIRDAFLGPDGDMSDPYASPLDGDLNGLPPTLVQVGDHEVLLDDSTRLETKARAAGVDITVQVWPEMVHVWHTSASFVPEADQAIAGIAEFLKPKLGV